MMRLKTLNKVNGWAKSRWYRSLDMAACIGTILAGLYFETTWMVWVGLVAVVFWFELPHKAFRAVIRRKMVHPRR